MKFTAENLQAFFALLPAYESLPVPVRREVASIQHPSQTSTKYDFRSSFAALVDAGFLQPAASSDRWKVAPERQTFVRLLGTLQAHPVLRWGSEQAFSSYIADHLTPSEKKALLAEEPPSWDRNSALFRELTSPDYLESFLGGKEHGVG